MKRMFLIYCLLGFSLLTLAGAASNEQLSLQKAREIGRLKSNLLTAVKKTANPSLISNKANLAGFNKLMLPVFKKNCINCHGPKKSKGKFRVDELDPDLLKGPHINKWLEVYEVLSNDEMPPDDEPDFELADSDRSKMIDWLAAEMNKASHVRRNEAGNSSFRRMTKYEYNYALQDLLQLPYDFVSSLPPENISEEGFKNSSHLLQMSAMQFEIYRKIGLKSLKKATVNGDRPKMVNFKLSMQELMDKKLEKIEKELVVKKLAEIQETEAEKKLAEIKKAKVKNNKDIKNTKKINDVKKAKKKKKVAKKKKKGGALDIFNHHTGKKYRIENWPIKYNKTTLKIPPVSSTVYVLRNKKSLKLNMNNHLPDKGIMRVRIRVGRSTKKPNEYSSLRLIISAQTSNNANFSAIISKKDIQVKALFDNPEVIEFEIPLAEIPRNPLRNEKGKGRMVDEILSIQHISNAGKTKEPLNLYIDYLDVSGPYYKYWPPKTHENVFVKSENRNNEEKYGREILNEFMPRAWRRPITVAEVERFMGLFTKYRSDFTNFEDTMLEVLSTVLASPNFLYLTQTIASNKSKDPEAISELELASRLSFFLWSSIPDDELLRLAFQKKLSEPQILKKQTSRMLSDPRSQRFSERFVTQWLGLDGIDNVNINTKLYKTYDSSLKKASREEPVAYFNEVLKNNNSILDFIHSDYVVINERLAKHYKIPSVFGPQFRKVTIAGNIKRGGVLTTAGILTMNSDGKDSHPLKRGIWLIERILNDPPPPPPPSVPKVDLTDPRILKMTLKERMADHRNNPACMSCHSKIDPWGIAFENYDAVGGYRTLVNNKKVDATSELYNNQKLAGVIGLKRYILVDRQDQFVRAMVHKMTSYALGRHMSFKDRADIDEMTVKLRKNGDSLSSLVNLIVRSDLFHTK